VEKEFWLTRWELGQIGFHQPEVNDWLVRDPLAPGARTLVPLCGKTVDLRWLAAQGHDVTGVELSDAACAAVFAEAGLTPDVTEAAGYVSRSAAGSTVLCGDFFALHGAFDAVWDRAALIAPPPDMRARYAAKFMDLVRPGGEIRLITLDYPQHERSGPPFAVTPTEVERLYGAAFEISALGTEDALTPTSRYATWGVSHLTETAWRLIRKAA